jgi:hypothetical protein
MVNRSKPLVLNLSVKATQLWWFLSLEWLSVRKILTVACLWRGSGELVVLAAILGIQWSKELADRCLIG